MAKEMAKTRLPERFENDGQRKLHASGVSQPTVVERLKASKSIVSAWFTGSGKPGPVHRASLERWLTIPRGDWDRPACLAATPAPPPEPTHTPASTTEAAPGEAAPGESLGLDGLQRVILETQASLQSLSDRDRITARRDLARMQSEYAKLHRESQSAREAFLDSAEFSDICKTLLAAFPGDSLTFRDHLARAGVDLPLPPPVDVASQLGPPTSLEDLDALITQLRVAKEFRDGGEPRLAWAHTIGLELDLHAKDIANLLEAYPDHAHTFLDLLEPQDRASIESEFKLRIAITDVKSLPAPLRVKVASLVTALRHPDIASELA